MAREIPLGDMALLVARRLRRLPEGKRIHDCPCASVGRAGGEDEQHQRLQSSSQRQRGKPGGVPQAN